jgi:enoyl-CoA hydratase/carnithine racemase
MTTPSVEDVEQTVLVDVDSDGVATVTLNRPEKLNAMTAAMQVRYVTLLGELDRDPAVRAIVVTGAGRGFCAGADLGMLGGITSTNLTPEGVLLDSPARLNTPVIAAVNGAVAGMGFSYLLMADVRYASSTARIGSTFARLGLVAEWGSASLLPAIVGASAAADLLLTGRIVDAAEALSIGLVNKVLEPEELMPAALAWAKDVAVNTSPSSTASIKSQLREAQLVPPEEAFANSIELMLESFHWPDLAEALAARAEKRPPLFGPAPH